MCTRGAYDDIICSEIALDSVLWLLKARPLLDMRSEGFKHRIEGNPDPKYLSTSCAERSNLSVRIHTRRVTRLTNAFSKKVENHAHSVALFAMYYNFVRIHKTLRTTPAMAAGVTSRLWEIGDIVDVLKAWEVAGSNN
jgi:hypothetical protein